MHFFHLCSLHHFGLLDLRFTEQIRGLTSNRLCSTSLKLPPTHKDIGKSKKNPRQKGKSFFLPPFILASLFRYQLIPLKELLPSILHPEGGRGGGGPLSSCIFQIEPSIPPSSSYPPAPFHTFPSPFPPTLGSK